MVRKDEPQLDELMDWVDFVAYDHTQRKIRKLTRGEVVWLCASVVEEAIGMDMDDCDIGYSTAEIYEFFRLFGNLVKGTDV
ncbi:unnamed protein product [marine sediment metagenome]|uniref:Uncharacterized protein n=1 Tax=marine sediment metagenome TaxID=412755 RepID=X1D9W0_9ZZZZ